MRYLILLILTAMCLLSAATFTITPQEVGNDLTAIQADIKDVNNKMTGVVRIFTDLKDFAFTPNPAKVIYKTGEVQVFLSPGARKIVIAKEGFAKKEWVFPTSMEAGTVFKIELASAGAKLEDVAVTIQSNPPGATIFIDNEAKGTAEQQKVTVGSHDLKLVKAGYESFSEKIIVAADKTLFKYKLKEEEEAQVLINSNPSGAKVEIDGVKLGVTPLTSFYKSGKYKIALTKDGCDVLNDNIIIALPKTTKSYELKEIAAFLTINTRPAAQVFLNGNRITELKDIRLEPQRATILVKLKKAPDIEKTVILKRDDRITLDLFSEIATGIIQVAVIQENAQIELKGEEGEIYSAVGGKSFSDLVVGEYKLTVKAEGYKTYSEVLNLQADNKITKSLSLETGADIPDGFVFVEGGSFLMGGEDSEDKEKPVHKVSVTDFIISKYEVSVESFRNFINETGYITDAEKGKGSWIWKDSKWEEKSSVNWRNPNFNQTENCPVVCVSWNDASAYCKWLSNKTGLYYRLPTEAEWEYAARGGKESKGYKYSGSNDLNAVGWFFENARSKTHPIGEKQPNELGIYDMSGNVWEWCRDWSANYTKDDQYDPHGPDSAYSRVNRGGGFGYGIADCRAAVRGATSQNASYYSIGFRTVIDKSAYLTIKTNPKASIFIDGQKITNLANVRIKPRSLELRAVMNQAEDKVLQLNLKESERKNIDLFPDIYTNNIEFSVMPSNADVVLTNEDGQKYEFRGSKSLTNLPVGSYSAVVSAYGYVRLKETMILGRTNKLIINVNLKKISDVTPSGFVFVEGDSLKRRNDKKKVFIDDFVISKYELTQKEWEDVMGNNPSYFNGIIFSNDENPVEQVSLYDAFIFCNKKSLKEGLTPCYSIYGSTNTNNWGNIPSAESLKNAIWDSAKCNISANGYRLPLENEWIFAAKGGKYSKNYTYSGSNYISEVAWYFNYVQDQNSNKETHKVGQKKPNELGIYDMTGNVTEWCGGRFGYSSYGGDWYSGDDYVVDRKNGYWPAERDNHVGFRLARTP